VTERPLRGEPLSLDLVNTEWNEGGAPRDLFDEPSGAAGWLAEHGYADGSEVALREARAALRAQLEQNDPGPLNAVLARGTRRPVLGSDGRPGELVEVDPDWRPAWDAAVDHLRLLAERPDRVRGCAHPSCVLWFHDTSRNGTRRWCSMDACGNRAKAGRHYARTRGGGSQPLVRRPQRP
jgi:predicted RNA-binding Zn ribbon-like protein